MAHRGAVGAARPPHGGPHRLPHPRATAGQSHLNVLDVLVLGCAAAACVGGYRLGFLARVTSWVGLALGVVVAAQVLPGVLDVLDTATSAQLLIVALGLLLGAAFIGQAIGLLIGVRLHVALPGRTVRDADRVAGAGVGLVGVIVAVWVILPLMADVPGWWSSQARTSTVAKAIHEQLPDPPDTVETLRQIVGADQFPRVFDALQPAPELGPPPTSTNIPQPVVDAVVPSTVKISGNACSRRQEGSGWVAGPGIVVTNAHVVAGEDDTEVLRDDGETLDATVVAFDPGRDIAVLAVPGLERPALTRAGTDEGGVGAVFGHPGGGALRAAPFSVGRQVTARGRDIYDSRDTEREVLILASDLHPGDSGGALIDPQGRVVGMAFAIAPDKPGVSYALDMPEVDAVLATDLQGEVDTGPCLR